MAHQYLPDAETLNRWATEDAIFYTQLANKWLDEALKK